MANTGVVNVSTVVGTPPKKKQKKQQQPVS